MAVLIRGKLGVNKVPVAGLHTLKFSTGGRDTAEIEVMPDGAVDIDDSIGYGRWTASMLRELADFLEGK